MRAAAHTRPLKSRSARQACLYRLMKMRTPPLNQLASELTGALGRAVGAVPEARLRQLMSTPARRLVLDAVFWGLPRALNDTRAAELTTAVRCHVTGRPDGAYDVYWLHHE